MTYKSVTQHQSASPVEIVRAYYDVLTEGDVSKLKNLMTLKSYYMALHAFGLRLSFKDAIFKRQLAKIEESVVALTNVEERLHRENSVKVNAYSIIIQHVRENGTNRRIVEYTENGKVKEFYFSKESEGWRINYYAGREISYT